MQVKILIIALTTFISLSVFPQSADRLRLYVNNKKIYSARADSEGEALVSSAAKGKITICYSGAKKSTSKRSIMIFDTERHNLLHKDISESYGRFTFNIDSIKAKTGGKPFQIYTTAIPKDPEQAALVRMRPVLLCKISWKE